MLTAPHTADVEIPGEKFTFGVLADAQAASDLDALRAEGRRVASVVFDDTTDTTAGIAALVERLREPANDPSHSRFPSEIITTETRTR